MNNPKRVKRYSYVPLYLIINKKFLELIPSFFHLLDSIPGNLMINYHKKTFKDHLICVLILLHSLIVFVKKFCMFLHGYLHIFTGFSKLFDDFPDAPDATYDCTKPHNLITGDCESH